MGGTFDPIHLGHLVTAEAARAAFDLERVIFVPAGMPPHKTGQLVTQSKHRHLMAVLATVTNPGFEVSRFEVDRPGPSYTIDTVRHFRSEIGPDRPLYFITGADAVLELGTWHDLDGILAYADIIAATRPGYALEQRAGHLTECQRAHLKVLEVPALAISSSDIRRRVAIGAPIKYLVPEPVEYYIARNHLYQPVAQPVER